MGGGGVAAQKTEKNVPNLKFALVFGFFLGCKDQLLYNAPVVKVRRMLAMVCCRVDMVLAIVVGGGRENSKVCSCRSGFTIDMSEDIMLD